ncbi:DUF4843 domain-containing protein [Mucilaginibacter sp. UR6-11]|uniref:DUF4843 domain-containing protein n=1 Tax=Mucilaginibacter sp. UR6-11 TaxID=1435644 RepID=UPI001E6257D0|nr:DUF4843 domain-containing protein [Mucilaginibacter sp. UR6-11]MCC8426484.1 DUF4843 domain-containing protein [Mucilaginibacter sp. UR6-11]
MKIYKILLAIGGVIALAGCKKENLITYSSPDGKDNIYLGTAVTDTTAFTYTFAYSPAQLRDTVWVKVTTSGERVHQPRNFILAADPKKTTAVSALHYEALKASYTMPADSGIVHVPVILLNTDTALQNKTVKITLVVSGGAGFSTNLPIEVRSKQITFSNRLEKPVWWNYWGQLGNYSRVKHQLFLISSGTRDLVELNGAVDPNYFLHIPRCLYYINNVHEFLQDPFTWIQQNPSAGYKLTKRSDNTGDYDLYNVNAPDKKYWLKYFASVNKLIFIDENGNQIII